MTHELLEVLIKNVPVKAIQISNFPCQSTFPPLFLPFFRAASAPCSSTAGMAKKAGAWEVLYADPWVRRPSFEIPKRPLVFSTALMYPVQDWVEVCQPQNIKQLFYWFVKIATKNMHHCDIGRRMLSLGTAVVSWCGGLQATRAHLGSQQLHCLPGPSGATRTRQMGCFWGVGWFKVMMLARLGESDFLEISWDNICIPFSILYIYIYPRVSLGWIFKKRIISLSCELIQ